MTIEELIAALEAATGPSRELDAEIYEFHVGLKQYESVVRDGPDIFIRYYPGPPGPDYYRVPRYTASIDAALTLVPDGLRWRVANVPVHQFASASVSDGSILSPNTKEWEAKHTTPAIALCIAAIRARGGDA